MAVWHEEQEWFLTVIRNTIINELDELNTRPKGLFAFSKRRRFAELCQTLDTLQDVDGSVLFDKATVIASGVSVNPNEVSFSQWQPANPTATFNRTFSMSIASKQTVKQLCQAGFAQFNTYTCQELTEFFRLVFQVVHTQLAGTPPIAALPALMGNAGINPVAVVSQISLLFQNTVASTLPAGKALWHCGNIASTQGLHNGSPLWTTELQQNRLRYAGLYRMTQAAGVTGLAYCIELNVKTNLRVADFTNTSFSGLANTHCGGVHAYLAYCINAWAHANQFEALKGTNLGADEIVICEPAKHLDVVHAMEI